MSNTKLDVRVYPIDEPKGSVRAFASVSVDDLVAIRGIRVMEGSNGLFINMPQSKDPKTNEFHDIAFPVAKGLRQEISKAILDEYRTQIKEASADKAADKKPSLEEGLRNGAAKVAASAPAPKTGAMPKNADIAV